MQYLTRKEPAGSLAGSLQGSLQQLGMAIAQNLQQRRQRQETAAGLQALLPNISPMEAQMMAGLEPQALGIGLKEKLREPMYRGMSSLAGGLVQQSALPGEEVQIGQQAPTGTQPQDINKIGGINKKIQIPEMMTPQMADMVLKENASLRQLQEQRRANDLKEKKEIRKKIDVINTEVGKKKELLQHVKNVRNYWESGQVISGATKEWADKLGLGRLITNAPTQAAIKEMYNMVIDTIGTTKGFRGTNLLANLIQNTKPSEYNTKEGVKPILDGIEAFVDFGVKKDQLIKGEYKKWGQAPSLAGVDIEEGIEKEIGGLEKKLEDRLSQISAKAIGYTADESSRFKKVGEIPDPRTYNTFKEGKAYRRNGVWVGSDGIKERPLRMTTDEDSGRPVPIGFADEE